MLQRRVEWEKTAAAAAATATTEGVIHFCVFPQTFTLFYAVATRPELHSHFHTVTRLSDYVSLLLVGLYLHSFVLLSHFFSLLRKSL